MLTAGILFSSVIGRVGVQALFDASNSEVAAAYIKVSNSIDIQTLRGAPKTVKDHFVAQALEKTNWLGKENE